MSRPDGEAMCFKDHSVSQVLVGLHRIGIVGLADATRAAETSGFEDREPIVDLMFDQLATRNYIPERQSEAYRTALWREYLRHRGENISEFFSEIPVTVRGGTDEERDHLVRMTTTTLAEHELRPSLAVAPGPEENAELVLEINGEEVTRGLPTLNGLKRSVRHRLSDL